MRYGVATLLMVRCNTFYARQGILVASVVLALQWCCTVPCHAVLCCAAPCCAVLACAMPCCPVQCFMLCCTWLLQAFKGDYKWILYGDDDTFFFVDGVLELLQDFDPSLPYFITGMGSARPYVLQAQPQRQQHVYMRSTAHFHVFCA